MKEDLLITKKSLDLPAFKNPTAPQSREWEYLLAFVNSMLQFWSAKFEPLRIFTQLPMSFCLPSLKQDKLDWSCSLKVKIFFDRLALLAKELQILEVAGHFPIWNRIGFREIGLECCLNFMKKIVWFHFGFGGVRVKRLLTRNICITK